MGRSAVYEKGNGWIRLCEVVMYPLTRLLGKRRYTGIEKFTIEGPVLLVGNHISHLDPVYDAVFIRKSGRLPHILAKASLWKIPIVGKALVGSGQIPVERGGGSGQAALDLAIKSLAEGNLVLIYPEGTVTKEPDFWPMKPRPGVAALALSGDFPVIPVAHWGTQLVYNSYAPKGKFKPLPRKEVHVVAGEPIDLSAYRGVPMDARVIRDVSLVIMNAVRDLLAEVRGEPAPAELYDPKKAERLAARKAAAAKPAGKHSAVEPDPAPVDSDAAESDSSGQ